MQCGENRHTDIVNFATIIHTKTINALYGNYYPPHGEFELIYREICQMDLCEFYPTIWEKSPEMSKK